MRMVSASREAAALVPAMASLLTWLGDTEKGKLEALDFDFVQFNVSYRCNSLPSDSMIRGMSRREQWPLLGDDRPIPDTSGEQAVKQFDLVRQPTRLAGL